MALLTRFGNLVSIWLLESSQLFHTPWMSSRVYKADIKEFPYAQEFARNELIANPKEAALQVAKKLFDLFGVLLNVRLKGRV